MKLRQTAPTSGAVRRSGSPPVTDPAAMETLLQAISHGGRRAMLRLAWDAERTSSELAEAAGLSRSAASQHLKLLRDAGVVHVRIDANRRLYHVDVERLAALRAFLDDFWGDRLDDLKVTAEATTRQRRAHRWETA
jgi:DNA-binding transcriptional ArsR family regulator